MVKIGQETTDVLLDWGNTLMEDPGTPGPMAFWPVVRAVPGAKQLLERLHARGLRLSVATNGDVSDSILCRKALARVGLDGRFDRIFSSKDLGCEKPAAEFFARILSELGVAPSRTMMIGDSFVNDVEGPVALGISAIWFNRGTGETKNGSLFTTVHSLDEIV